MFGFFFVERYINYCILSAVWISMVTGIDITLLIYNLYITMVGVEVFNRLLSFEE